MHRIFPSSAAYLVLAAALCAQSTATRTSAVRLESGTPDLPLIGQDQAYSYVCRPVGNPGRDTRLVDETYVSFTGASYLRVRLAGLRLGRGSFVEIFSLRDGATQRLDQQSIRQQGQQESWSAYFNGDQLRVRLFAGPRTRGNAYEIPAVEVGRSVRQAGPESLCGPDSRRLSYDKRVARLILKINGRSYFASGFLCEAPDVIVTAGHALTNPGLSSVMAEFNTPLSSSSGWLVHSGPADQYLWQGAAAAKWENNGLGRNWGVFLTHRNAQTGKLPGDAQGSVIWRGTVPALRRTLRLTGHGVDSTPNLTYRGAQQSATGPLYALTGSALRHRVDTEAGSLGSPILDATTDRLVGIQTHTGCLTYSSTSSNGGTVVHYVGFKVALESFVHRPDLVVTVVRPTTNSVSPNQLIRVDMVVKNAGRGPCGPSQLRLYHSTDAKLDASDLDLTAGLPGGIATKSLNPDESVQVSATVRMPATLPRGASYLIAFADQPDAIRESDEGNNLGNATIFYRPSYVPKPDLVPTITRFGPFTTPLRPGAWIHVWVTVKNIGDAPSNPSTCDLYVSKDAKLDAADTRVHAGIRTPGLQPKESTGLQVRFQLMQSLPNGTCFGLAFADAGHSNVEHDEGNNVAAKATNCVDLADLVPTLKLDKTKVMAGATIQISGFVTNAGTKDAGASRMRFTLPGRPPLNWGIGAVGAFGGTSRTVRDTYTVPFSVLPGVHTIRLAADVLGQVPESDEGNNTTEVQITVIDICDLLPHPFKIEPKAPAAGEVIKFSGTIQNFGPSPAPPTRAGFYLSRDPIITTDDIFLQERPVPGLAKGFLHSFSRRQMLIPAATEPGKWYIGIFADHAETATETNETNNTRSLEVTIAAPPVTTRAIEFLPKFRSPTLSSRYASFSATVGGSVKLRLTAPGLPGLGYLCVLSQRSRVPAVYDVLTHSGLILLNTPTFQAWLGRLDSKGRAAAGFYLAPKMFVTTGFNAYASAFFFDPASSTIVGNTKNSIRLEFTR